MIQPYVYGIKSLNSTSKMEKDVKDITEKRTTQSQHRRTTEVQKQDNKTMNKD